MKFDCFSHKAGLRDMPNFKSGMQFLLPVDVFITVDPEKWDIDMREIMGDSYGVRSKRPIKMSKNNREKVKVPQLLCRNRNLNGFLMIWKYLFRFH